MELGLFSAVSSRTQSETAGEQGRQTDAAECEPSDSVVFVSQQFPPDRSGHASRIHYTSRTLAEDGWDVTVLAPPASFPPTAFDRSWELRSSSTVDGVAVNRLWSWQPTGADPGFLSRMCYYSLFAVHAMFWLLANGRQYDVVVTTTPPISTGLAGIPATLCGQRWVVDVRDLWIDASVSLGFISEGGLLERVSRSFQRRVLLTADSISVTTKTLGETLCEQYGATLSSKLHHIPNGVDIGQFRSLTDGGTTGESSVLIYTGNIGHAQDLDTCIRALTHLPDDVELWLVGGGDAVPQLEQLAADLGVSDRIELLGTVDHDRIPELLSRADVGLAPLEDDEELAYAMPTKVYEYLGCKLPAVVTGQGELRRFIAESGGGRHADNDPESIAATVEPLLADAELRAEVGQQGYEYVSEQYDRKRIAHRFSDHLRELVATETETAT